MHVRLKGVHRVRKTLASGETAVYHYAWRGGPRIDAEPGTPDFVRVYTEAHAARKRPPTGTMFALISGFRSSAEFTSSAPSTQKEYGRYLKLIENAFGDMPIEALSDPAVRGVFKGWRDGMASTPRKADYAWTTLARVLSVAKDRGRIPVNPCERGGRLYTADRTERLWGEAELARILSVAPERMELALLLALWTGQRQGDLLRLAWSAYDGTRIRLRQSKGGRAVVVRAGGPLRLALERAERIGPLILTNTYGRPWTSDGFRTSWAKLCRKAGIVGLTFHDLRGSAVTRLAIEGATPQEIASVTGHSISDVCDLLDRHYLGDRALLAENAIRKLETGTKSVKRL